MVNVSTQTTDDVDPCRTIFSSLLEETTKQGIACVCLNIGGDQDDEVLKRLYGNAAYLRTPDVSKAVPALRRLMKSAIVNASAK